MHVDVSAESIRVPFLLARKLRKMETPYVCVLVDFYKLYYGGPDKWTMASVQVNNSDFKMLDHAKSKYALFSASHSADLQVRAIGGDNIYRHRLILGKSEGVLLVISMLKSGATWEEPTHRLISHDEFLRLTEKRNILT